MRLRLLVPLTILLLAPEVLAVRAIPDDNLAYPVLIALQPSGTGSGFFINRADGIYLVTARHVLFTDTLGLRGPRAELTAYSKNPDEVVRNIITLDLAVLQKTGDLRAHPSRDVAVVRIASVTPDQPQKPLQVLPGVSVVSHSASGILGAGPDTIRKYEQVLVANEVLVFGYPTSLGLRQVPQLDLSRPLLRRGIVAGLNPSLRSIVLDCPVYPGNSGGPVLQIDTEGLERHFRIIGVVSQFVPFVETWVNATHGYENASIGNSGYSIVTPMDYVLELVH